MEVITISKKEYECLRRHLLNAVEIFNGLEVDFGSEIPPKETFKKNPLKRSMKDIKNEFSEMIGSGKKAGKPNYLKNK